MEWLVWIGAALTLLGLIGIILVVLKARRAQKEGLTGEAMQARLMKLIPLNLGAFAVSTLGLMCVAFGVILG